MASNAANKFIIIAFLLITALFIYIYLPFIFSGPAAPFFVIKNHDINSHEVTVEVFDQHNKSIINETYNIEPKSDLVRSRPLSLKFSREKKEYIFKVTMDKQSTNTTKMDVPHQFTTVYISLYIKDYKSGETIPIHMETEMRA